MTSETEVPDMYFSQASLPFALHSEKEQPMLPVSLLYVTKNVYNFLPYGISERKMLVHIRVAIKNHLISDSHPYLWKRHVRNSFY